MTKSPLIPAWLSRIMLIIACFVSSLTVLVIAIGSFQLYAAEQTLGSIDGASSRRKSAASILSPPRATAFSPQPNANNAPATSTVLHYL